MAVGQISTTNATGSSTAGVAATATITADVGDVLIVIAGADDVASADALGTTAVTDSAGNTWSRLTSQQNTDATPATFAALAIYGSTITNALTGGTVTLTAHASSAVKDFTLYRFTGLSLTIRGVNGGMGTGTTPAALASSAPLDGDLVIAATVLEGPTADTWTADADTTGGSWSANVSDGTTGGTATNNITIRSQYKIVNATGTQTYNGSNSVSRDWCRALVVLAPSPPPASAPLPPAYVARSTTTFDTGVGRITASEIDCVAISDAFDRTLPPVVFCPGVYNNAAQLTGYDLLGLVPIIKAVCDEGYVVVATTTLGSFGNAAGRTGVTNALAYARTTYGCSTKPAALIGASEGACDAMSFAYMNPTLISCVVGLIPIIDLAEMVEQNVLSLASAVLSAWGVGALPLPTDADPMTTAHKTTLAQIPMQHWYSTDDEVSANITSFQQSTSCDVRAVGPLGHSSAAIAASWPTDIARFIRKRAVR